MITFASRLTRFGALVVLGLLGTALVSLPVLAGVSDRQTGPLVIDSRYTFGTLQVAQHQEGTRPRSEEPNRPSRDELDWEAERKQDTSGRIQRPRSPRKRDDPGTAPPAESAWRLQVVFSVPSASADGGFAYNRLVAGVSPTATDGFDSEFEIRALLTGPVAAFFNHTGSRDFDKYSRELWQDIRSNSSVAEWFIDVTATPGKDVLISWSLPTNHASCGTHEITLNDLDGILPAINLCAGSFSTYPSNGGLKQFMLRVSPLGP